MNICLAFSVYVKTGHYADQVRGLWPNVCMGYFTEHEPDHLGNVKFESVMAPGYEAIALPVLRDLKGAQVQVWSVVR